MSTDNRKNVLICYGDSNTYGYAPTRYGDFRYPDALTWPFILADMTDMTAENCGLCGREIPRNQRQIEAVCSLVRRAGDSVADVRRPAADAADPDRSEGENNCGGGPGDTSHANVVSVRLLVMLGTNDLLKHGDFLAEDVTVRMGHFLKGLLKEPSLRKSGRLCLIVPPAMQRGEWVDEPRLIRESIRLNETYAALARERNIPCIRTGDWDIPLVYDGVHFTEEGHRIFADRLAACLRKP